MEKTSHKRNMVNKGFTLIELVVIMAIIMVMAAVITVAVIRYIEKGRQAKDIYNASLIKDAMNTYVFPSDFQGQVISYEDPETHATEAYKRGWVYVDKDEIRCSDASTALAMIDFGLVDVSDEFEKNLREHEEDPNKWFPSGPDGDYYRRTGINEYAFKNDLTVNARRTWNTYQLDVYIDDDGELHMGASASNAIRTGGHAKDSETAEMFAKKLGFNHAMITPIGEQHSN